MHRILQHRPRHQRRWLQCWDPSLFGWSWRHRFHFRRSQQPFGHQKSRSYLLCWMNHRLRWKNRRFEHRHFRRSNKHHRRCHHRLEWSVKHDLKVKDKVHTLIRRITIAVGVTFIIGNLVVARGEFITAETV